jgi:hypothetical protein
MLLLLTASGCSPTKPFFGSWIAHRSVNRPPAMSRGAYDTASELTVKITPDGFTMVDAGEEKTGTVEYTHGIAYLHVTTIMGQLMDRQDEQTQRRNVPIRLTPQPDGTLIYYDPAGFDQNGLVLKRDTSPAANS